MRVSRQTHPDAADLEAFGLGRMSADRSADIGAHVLGCAECGQALQQTPNDAWVDHFRRAATADSATAADAPAPAELRGHPRYRILKLLGRGGMGAVYLAEHGVMQRRVALKVVKPEYTSSPTAVKRFRREIHAAARLHHPNIVAAHDAEQAGEAHFLVMEYIDGVSLDRLVADQGPLPVAEASEYVRQAALGLQHAHERGMVHRDVKPHNLIRTADGVVKVLDFGLASVAEPGEAWATGPNVVMGTPDYIAPEQAEDAHAADARADIYALGCTLYFLLTGRPPFARSSPLRTLLAHRDEAPTPLEMARPDAPAGLAAVLGGMTAKAPAERLQTAAEVAVALAPFAGAKAVQSRSDRPAPRGANRPRSRRLRAVGAAAALLAILIAAAVVVRITTDQGDVTIETDDPSIDVVVKKGGQLVRIFDPQSKQSWELDSQKYQLGMADQPDGLTIELKGREPVVLKRKGEKLVTITRGPPSAAGSALKPAMEPKAAFPQELEVVRRLPWPGQQPLPRTAFSADGRLCCACGGDLVRVWDVETGRVQQDFTGLPPETYWIVFLPDGKQLLSSHFDGSFHRLDLATGKAVGELQADVGWNQIHGVTPDGGRFCWWGRDDLIHVWDLETGKERFRVAPAGMNSLLPNHHFSPDGRRLLTADQMPNGTGLLRVFDVSSGERIRSIETDVQPDTPTWSEDGRRIYLSGATAGGALSVVVAGFDAETGKEISRVPLAPAPRASGGRCFSRDARWFAVQYPELALVHLYETETGKLVAAAHGPDVEFTFSFSPKGTYAACGKRGEVILYRLPALPSAKKAGDP